MKKTFIALLAIASVAACNKADIIETVEGEAIEFSNAFVNNATKATDPTYGAVALESFDVYGTVTGTAGTINIFNGAEVTGEVGANVWTCGVKQYWIAGASYKFAAVVDADAVTQDENTKMPTALTYATAGQKDLLYAEATATGQASANGKVNFTFNHLLAKAQFTVTSTTEDGYYYSVKNIKINNFANGTYTIATETWAGTTPTDIEFGNIEKVTADDTDGLTCACQRLLIPTTESFKVSFTVELWNDINNDGVPTNDVKLSTETFSGATAKTVDTDLAAGNAYNFKIDLSVGELIEFTVTQNPTWTPATGGTDVAL